MKKTIKKVKPIVAVIMGSQSDWETMKEACLILKDFDVPFSTHILSAHRTPDDMRDFALTARDEGYKVIIAGAGGAAHLPGMTASYTTLPVIGVPVIGRALQGIDSLYSIVQMPKGIPVATVAIGNAANAGLLAVQMLSILDEKIVKKLDHFREKQTLAVRSSRSKLN